MGGLGRAWLPCQAQSLHRPGRFLSSHSMGRQAVLTTGPGLSMGGIRYLWVGHCSIHMSTMVQSIGALPEDIGRYLREKNLR